MKRVEEFIIEQLLKVGFIRRWFERKAEIVENTDPDAVKVSDIANYFGIPTIAAKKLCDMACRQQLYIKNEDGTYKLNDKKTNVSS